MERYTIEQRVFVIKNYFKYGESYAEVGRKYRTEYGRENCPSNVTIRKIVQKFVETGSVKVERSKTYRRSGRSDENIAAVSVSVVEQAKTSIPHRSQQLNIPKTTLFRILHKDLHLKAYKIQITQEIKPTDFGLRRHFVNWAIQQKLENVNFFNKIIFSDEAHFQLGGFVNKQNCRIWAEENPREIMETRMHPLKVTVWCGLWAGGVIGPYFFEDANGNAVTVNGDRYRTMLNNFLWHEVEHIDVQNMWFQQDGATCHTAAETINLLAQKFGNRIISRRGNINWPPRSCDLTPLDFFLWGYLKQKVYVNNPQTIDDLKENISDCIQAIQPQLCHNVIENFAKRIVACRTAAGGHLEDIVFHY